MPQPAIGRKTQPTYPDLDRDHFPDGGNPVAVFAIATLLVALCLGTALAALWIQH